MNYIILLITTAIWWMLPAYFANGMPVAFGGGAPLDFGKKLRDGHRVLGSGKTWRGTLIGVALGILIGILQGRIYLGILLVIGAMFGDLLASFIKRRTGKEQGHPFAVVDQLDFVLGALLFASVLEFPALDLLVAILVVTPLIHVFTNYIAYKAGLKKVWW